MSGLDTSQALTDDVSLHAAENHVHSHPNEPETWRENQPKNAGAAESPDASAENSDSTN